MANILSAAKTILEADATLVALATGGIWDWDETGRMGISRSNAATATAWTNGNIKPCLLLKLRSDMAFGEIGDDVAGVTGARAMLEVWAYQDSGYSIIKSMLDRVFVLLHGKRVGGIVCRWTLTIQPRRDAEMDANVERADYEVFYVRS